MPTWTETDAQALKHAWDWFALHANQRMQTFTLMLASVALALAGYGVAIQAKNYTVAVVAAVGGATITALFAGLDARNKELIRAAEAALRPLQAKLGDEAGVQALTFADDVHTPKHRLINFTTLIRTLAVVLILIFVTAILAAAWLSSQESQSLTPGSNPESTRTNGRPGSERDHDHERRDVGGAVRCSERLDVMCEPRC